MLRKRTLSVLFAALFVSFATVTGAPGAVGTTSQTSLLQAVNATRRAHHLRPLRVDAGLERAAQAHTAAMLRGDFFSHGDFSGRMASFHLHGTLGENLAWGTGSLGHAQAIVRMWLASPPHRANLLRPGYSRIGLGVAGGSFQGTPSATVVTADFGG